jgi:benzoate-CoA ligase family protein
MPMLEAMLRQSDATPIGDRPTVDVPDRMNVAELLLDRHVQEGRGDRVAIYYGDDEITYAQILENTNRAGNLLRQLDVRIEDRVLLLMPDCPELVSCFLGAIKLGAVPIPTNTLMKPPDYEYMLGDSRAVVAVVGEQLLPQIEAIPRERLRHLREIVVVGAAPAGARSYAELASAASPQLDAEEMSKDDTAFWLYSSGSTGFPKGCVHFQQDMLVCAELYARGILEIGPEDRSFSVAKLFFAYGLGNGLYFPFYVGGSTVLWPGPPTPDNVFRVVERYRPTLFYSVPTSYAMLLATEGRYDLGSIRQAVSAGEALPPAIFQRFKERFGVEILDGIGSTEILHIFISNRPGEVRPGSSGRLVPGYEALLLDDDGAAVPTGEVGNLLIKGDSTCAAYWNKRDQTRQTILGEWIKTGDKYSRDEDGYYWYAGRSDDMLKVGGIWVSPIEIENTLVEHPAVLECGVVGREDADRLTKPQAYVVLGAGHEPSDALADELIAFVRGRIAEYKRPRWVHFVPELPKTATGKTQRFKLRQLDADNARAMT